MKLRSLVSIGLLLGCSSSAGEVSDQPIGDDPGAGGDTGSGGDAGTNGASGDSGSGATGAGGSAGSDPGTGGTGAADGGLGAGGTGGGDPGDAGPLEPARQLALGSAALVGVTEDGHAVYRTAAGSLHAIPVAPGAS